MRIIGGNHKGIRILPPRDLPVRPTTEMAREALFNILANRVGFSGGIHALDLFSGTGGISLELASRGVSSVVAVDRHPKCVRFLAETASRLHMENIRTVRADVFKFIERYQAEPFDLIFADPPYDLDRLTGIPALVGSNQLLKKGGLLVLEYPSHRTLPTMPPVSELRKYGNSSFAFYEYSAFDVHF